VKHGPNRGWRVVLGLALAFLVVGCAADPFSPTAPLPSDLRVVPPPSGVSAEHARYSGRWVGKWDEQLEHVLIVELEVPSGATTEVIAVYSWGSGTLGVGLPGWSRVRGRIENGALMLDLTRVQATVVYTMQADGTLVAEYWRGDQVTARARLTRAPRERI
jgi:hypothetical protein